MLYLLGYTTNTKCSKWPKEVCNVTKKKVKKYTPITACTKEPRQLCAPAGRHEQIVIFLANDWSVITNPVFSLVDSDNFHDL